MEPKDYKVIYFEAGDFTDDHGNHWCNILFEEAKNEPIRIVVKDPNQYSVGQTLFGHIETKTSKAGKPYLRFYKDQRPDTGFTQAGSIGKYQPKDDHTQESIARSVALKAAVDYLKTNELTQPSEEVVLNVADQFLVWLQTSGTQGRGEAAKVAPPASNETRSPESTATRPWERVGKPKDDDAEALSLYQTIANQENQPEPYDY